MHLLHTTTSTDPITHISWGHSPLLGHLVAAAASSPSNCIVVIRAQSGEAVTDVHESPLALASIHLSSHGHLLMVAEHGLCLTAVSVDSAKRVAVLPFIKPRGHTGAVYDVCQSGRFAAVVTMKDGVDGLCVLNLHTGRVVLVKRGAKQLGGVADIVGVRWVVDERTVLIWGSATDANGYGAIAMVALTGAVMMAGDPACEETFRLGQGCVGSNGGNEGLGINTVRLNAQRSLAVVGGYDGVLRMMNLVTWREVIGFSHESPCIDEEAPPVIFRERTKEIENEEGEGDEGVENASGLANVKEEDEGEKKRRVSYFEVVECGDDVEISKRMRWTDGPRSTRFGISFAEFSSCGQYVASRSDKAANVVFVWDVCCLRLFAVLILEQDATCISWSRCISEKADGDETLEEDLSRAKAENGYAKQGARNGEDVVGAQLAIVSGGEYVYMWRRSGAAAVRIRPTHRWRGEFMARKVAWGCDSSALVVSDGISAKAFLVVYPT